MSHYEQICQFRVPVDLAYNDKKLLEQLLAPFWNETRLRDILLPILNHSSCVSLRVLDWLATNYAKSHRVVYAIEVPPDGRVQLFDLHRAYQDHLEQYRRRGFDPFRRKKPGPHGPKEIWFSVSGEQYATTVAQLNFMYWAHRYGVLRYAAKYYERIAHEMKNNIMETKRRRALRCTGKPIRKRKEISQRASGPCFVYPVAVAQELGMLC